MTTRPPIWNEADAMRFLSFCIELTARMSKDMAEQGDCDPQLYDSLKAMQLAVDRELRAYHRAGVTPDATKNLPDIPETFE
jgi:hypothetical protein